MCGIVGYVGREQAAPILLDGLQRLEYRGYDSAGIAVCGEGGMRVQKAKGRLLPFGWFHLLKALWWKRPRVLDLLLVAVRPDYQSKGVNALLFTDLIPVYQQMGFEYAESNPELEANDRVQSQWQYFHTEQHKRRRCYRADL